MILLLAGTSEARNLAGLLREADLPVVASLAGVTDNPLSYPCETRVGGFGGEAGFLAEIAARGITAVIDATHPFATQITERSARLCLAHGMPYLRLERPEWRSRTGDAWHEVAGFDDLPRLIPAGARVFCATGRQSLASLAPLAQGRTVFLRVIDPQETPFPYDGAFITARPPFDTAAETEVLRQTRATWLVVKNAGGVSGRAKLDAARALGLSVAMIARPAPPAGITRREQVLDALEWAEAHAVPA